MSLFIEEEAHVERLAGLDGDLSLPENDADRRFLDNDTENDNTRLDYIRLDNEQCLEVTRSPPPVGHRLEKDWAAHEDTQLEDHRLEENTAAQMSPHDPAVAPSLKVSTALNAIDKLYLLPTTVITKPFIAAGSFLAGFVVESTGTKDPNAPSETGAVAIRTGSAKRNGKKQKITKTQWHALFLADETNMVKVWCRANDTAAPNRKASVARLADFPAGTFVAVYIHTGPVEVAVSNPAFKRYVMCSYDVEVQTIKAKPLRPVPDPAAAVFALAAADAVEADSWNELDAVVHKGTSFEATCTLAVIGLNGRHTISTARNGTRYLSGYVQDKDGVCRYLSVFAQIPAFLKSIPVDVAQTHVVVRFTRLRVRTMENGGPGNRTKVASVTNNTSFETLDMSFEAFSSLAAAPAGHEEDLNGFF